MPPEDDDNLTPRDRILGGIPGRGGLYRRMRLIVLLVVVVVIVGLLAKAF